MKSKEFGDYQNILRAIGQGIEALGVESFDLEIIDDCEFVVSGTFRDAAAVRAPKSKGKASFLSLIASAAKNCGKQKTGSTLFQFSQIRFTKINIETLDEAGKASRWSRDGSPLNPLGIAHVLRMAGSYLDSKSSRFTRLSWRHQTLTLWRINGMGVEAKDIFTSQNLYDQWVHHFKTRKPSRLLKATGND